jgi:hypothetical protein
METTMRISGLYRIAAELRDFARNAHGHPATVQITAKTLLEYAEAIETMAAATLSTEGVGGN